MVWTMFAWKTIFWFQLRLYKNTIFEFLSYITELSFCSHKPIMRLSSVNHFKCYSDMISGSNFIIYKHMHVINTVGSRYNAVHYNTNLYTAQKLQ